jgi:hypothetical protein
MGSWRRSRTALYSKRFNVHKENKTLAAELLKLNRTTFIERLRKKGMLQWTHHTPFSAAVVNHVTSTGAPLTEPAAKPWTPHSAAPADATKVGSLSF